MQPRGKSARHLQQYADVTAGELNLMDSVYGAVLLCAERGTTISEGVIIDKIWNAIEVWDSVDIMRMGDDCIKWVQTKEGIRQTVNWTNDDDEGDSSSGDEEQEDE